MALAEVAAVVGAALVGAVGNRVRGGIFAVPGGTQVGRLVGWGLPVGVACWLGGVPWWGALVAGLSAFLGCCVGQYGGLSMGHRGPAPAVSPWLTMTAWGMARVLGPFIVLVGVAHTDAALRGAAWVFLSGALCAPIYWAVWHVPPSLYLRGLGYGDGPATGYDPPELAEAVHGGAMLAALVAGILR